ncbi:hypothetical protein AB0O07_32055 [Streptomyces sp. NPDC093085]|uniref:hypothetical protein n=1 Tax=Streptomyces sp. NPDC093085 TaxID=3155068 RepID=UPI0034279A18
MGMVIRAAATASPVRASAPDTSYTANAPDTSVRLAARAAQGCLDEAGLAHTAVGVLVNVGVYRENNTIEPAMAALVQKELGLGLDYLADPVAGLSFDLMNGACGVLNAVKVAQALIGTSTTERVLITAADVHPGGDAGADPGYPYADLGAALLLERHPDEGPGFGTVRAYSARGTVGAAGSLDLSVPGGGGRSRITVRQEEGWAERLLELTAESVGAYVRDEGLALDRTLLVTNRPVPGFPELLAARLGVAGDGVVAAGAPESGEEMAGGGTGVPHTAGTGVPHTAAPVLGYLAALERRLKPEYEQLLFVSAGAGPSVVCARYLPGER